MRAGQAPRFLYPRDVIFHVAQQPHTLQTHEAGVLTVVFWRNGFGTLPVLSEDPSESALQTVGPSFWQAAQISKYDAYRSNGAAARTSKEKR